MFWKTAAEPFRMIANRKWAQILWWSSERPVSAQSGTTLKELLTNCKNTIILLNFTQPHITVCLGNDLVRSSFDPMKVGPVRNSCCTCYMLLVLHGGRPPILGPTVLWSSETHSVKSLSSCPCVEPLSDTTVSQTECVSTAWAGGEGPNKGSCPQGSAPLSLRLRHRGEDQNPESISDLSSTKDRGFSYLSGFVSDVWLCLRALVAVLYFYFL